MTRQEQIDRLRRLAEQYMSIARQPVMDERRALWRGALSLRSRRVPVRLQFGMWNVWCREFFLPQLQCDEPTYRQLETHLLVETFHAATGDDDIFEPWYRVWPSRPQPGWGVEIWGVTSQRTHTATVGGAWKNDPPLKDWNYRERLQPPTHAIDEADTQRRVALLRDAVGDILPLAVDRQPVLLNFCGDISTHLAELRGLEQMMLDMYEAPEQLHGLLAFMRDAILRNQQQAEDAGHFTLTLHENQMCHYTDELPDPRPNTPCRRQDLWGFMAAQEFALVSPAQHEEFLLRYQLPILRHYGLVHYGCCEDLTQKIDLLRQIPNLRSIAVSPMANLARCAEQIGGDYFVSWRPSPAEMVATEWNPDRARRVLREGVATMQANGCAGCILLKDIESVGGDTDRLRRFVELAREAVSTAA